MDKQALSSAARTGNHITYRTLARRTLHKDTGLAIRNGSRSVDVRCSQWENVTHKGCSKASLHGEGSRCVKSDTFRIVPPNQQLRQARNSSATLWLDSCMIMLIRLFSHLSCLGKQDQQLTASYICTHICTYACQVWMYVSMYVCMCVCMYLACMYACVSACMRACVDAWMHGCMEAVCCMYACMYVCMQGRMYVVCTHV